MRLYMLQSFILGILVSYLQRRIKCVFKNCGYPESWRGGGGQSPPPRGARGAPSPQCGAGWGAINHVTEIGFHSVIWYLSDQKGHCERARGATLRSHPEEPPQEGVYSKGCDGRGNMLDTFESCLNHRLSMFNYVYLWMHTVYNIIT